MSNLIRLTGLWVNFTKKGEKMLKGKLSPITQLLIMPNDFKRDQNDPDYYLYLRPSDKADIMPDTLGQPTTQAADPTPAAAAIRGPVLDEKPEPEPFDEELGF